MIFKNALGFKTHTLKSLDHERLVAYDLYFDEVKAEFPGYFHQSLQHPATHPTLAEILRQVNAAFSAMPRGTRPEVQGGSSNNPVPNQGDEWHHFFVI